MKDPDKRTPKELLDEYNKYKKLGIMPIQPGDRYAKHSTPSGRGGCPTCGGYLWVITGSTPQTGSTGICDQCMVKATDIYKASKKLNFLE